MEDVHILVGKTINSILLSHCQTKILFRTNEGDFCFKAESSCCSECWVESVEDASSILGAQVTDVIEHSLKIEREDSGDDICEAVEFINYDLKTLKGVCTIDFRNSFYENYYGGSLILISSDYYEETEFTKEIK